MNEQDTQTVERVAKASMALGFNVISAAENVKNPVLAPEFIQAMVTYNPITGVFFWKSRPLEMFKDKGQGKIWNVKHSGKPAFTAKNSYGYCVSPMLNISQKAHRVAWVLMTGQWPDKQIDHINGDCSDNRWENLRLVTVQENAKNQKLSKRNTSGVMGVYYRAGQNAWVAQIGIDGKKRSLGTFKKKEAAIEARKNAEANLGYHQNHGRTA